MKRGETRVHGARVGAARVHDAVVLVHDVPLLVHHVALAVIRHHPAAFDERFHGGIDSNSPLSCQGGGKIDNLSSVAYCSLTPRRHHETAQQVREAFAVGHRPTLHHEAALRAGRRPAEQPVLRVRGRMKLAGRTAFISGASRNIGRAIALAFAAEGADLVLNTRVNRDELEAVAAECRKAGVRVVPVLGDIADASTVEVMVKHGLAELGAIDVLVCNAAIRPHTAVTETSLDDWHRVRAVIPGMKERRRGSIIAIGGQSSLTGRPHTAAVTAAKTGLLGLVRALAAEL